MIWEYKKLTELNISADKLNELGAQGWEHYLILGNVNYFKRQIVVLKGKSANAAKDKQ